jgi:hypothetical protein
MRPDGSFVRQYPINLPDDVTLQVRERVSVSREHSCIVRTQIHGKTQVVTRLVVDGSGVVRVGPEEVYRAPDYAGDWLPLLFTLHDFVAILMY